MNLRLLRYFVAVADSGTITKAAEKLYMSQPPLSKQLQIFENELGVQLFERTKKNVRLTKAGELLRVRADQIFALTDQTAHELLEVDSGVVGTLSIGVIPSSSYSIISELLPVFSKLYPKVKYSIIEDETSEILRRIDERWIDIGLVLEPIDSESYQVLPLLRAPSVVAIHKSNPLCEQFHDSISIADIKDQPVIVPRRALHSLTREKTEKFSNIVCVSTSALLAVSLVEKNMGVAIVPSVLSNLYVHDALRYIPLKDTEEDAYLALVWNKEPFVTAPARHFIDFCIEQKADDAK